MYIVLLVIIVILAVFLCFIVTIQNPKGGGLAAGFASSNQIMGVRKTTDLLEKTTWGLIACIAVLSILTAFVVRQAPESHDSIMLKSASEQQMVNPEVAPVYDIPSAEEIPAIPEEN